MERDQLNTQNQAQISKKPTGVLYLDGNKAFYFEQTLTSPIPLDIPADVIANFELLNRKKLNKYQKIVELPLSWSVQYRDINDVVLGEINELSGDFSR